MEKKKILLISISTGSGHVRAAEAIKKTTQQNHQNLEIEHIDMADYLSKPMKKTILESYDIIAKKAPGLWGFFYKKTNTNKLNPYTKKMSAFFNQFNSAAFFKYILDYNPTDIICTVFLAAYAIMPVQKKNKLEARISLVMTDYFPHELQITKNIKHYFASSEKAKYNLIDSGIESKNITVSGIPIDPIFYKEKNENDLKNKYNIDNDRINLLILSGGQGLVDTSNIIKQLQKTKNKYKVFAIAGKNESLKKKLEELGKTDRVELNILGWTDKIDEYMRISDYIITKPGGLTTTECIIIGKPIMAISPIPGQEECNAQYILENNYGVVAREPSDILYYLDNLNNWKLTTKKPPVKPAAEIILEKLTE